MRRFIRYWNQNRRKIIIIITIIVFIIMMIRITDNIIGKQNNNTNIYWQNVIVDSDIPTKSVITKTEVSIGKARENKDIIQDFVDFCNEKDIESAYSLLSDNCKKNIFETVDVFKKNYYDEIFRNSKTINLELWIANEGIYTYKVTYYGDDLLETGGVSQEKFEDYISVVKQENETKININNFIGEVEINKKQVVSNIEVYIKSKLVYRDYEIYNIIIKNNTDKEILINDGQNSQNICLIDENETIYNSFINEIPLNNLILKSGYQNSINIKFNKMYSAYRNIEKIRFKDVILDYNQYIQNSESLTNKVNIDIDVK